MRQLFALIALISGLAAISAPETARAGAIENALTQLAEQSSKLGSERSQKSQPTQEVGDRRTEKSPPAPRGRITIVIPTLQFGPDRALE